MKGWQIFLVGVAVLIAALLLPSYESALAGLAAVLMVALVALGFVLRPRKDIFYLRRTLVVPQNDSLSVEHDRVAVRVELARLWLLFVPTFVAVAFLVITSATRTTWKFSILDRFFNATTSSYLIFLAVRLFLVGVLGILSTWLSECWVFRDAEACSADYVSITAGLLLYSFKCSGEYYGGEGVPFGLVRSPKLARLVFHNVLKPQQNKIAMGCLFHSPVILGHGITDFDKATEKAHSVEVRPASQTT